MMKKTLFFAMMLCISMPALADTDVNAVATDNTDDNQKEEFLSDETIETGILYDLTNKLIKSKAPADEKKAAEDEKMEYGEKVSKWASMPKFGGFAIGKFGYSNREGGIDGTSGSNRNTEFSQRLIRFYLDGTILKDFKYRIQVQCNNASFHMKDLFVEWGHFKEIKAKIGQYKRPFGFENVVNPFELGLGDYSQLTQKLCGMGDRNGEANAGGRDQGIQLQGDLFPIGSDKHSLLHYQVMVSNGQGINTGDANSNKDVNGNIQIQPVKGLIIGAFGWIGKYTANSVTVDRKRWILGATFNKWNWQARFEYGHSKGYKISDYDKDTDTWKNSDKADAWYLAVGIPCAKWLRTWVKWDVYRDDCTCKYDKAKSIYSIAPNFRLHKNLLFQLQYNYVVEKATDKKYSQIWVETYFRF